jgi:hypothetical protein
MHRRNSVLASLLLVALGGAGCDPRPTDGAKGANPVLRAGSRPFAALPDAVRGMELTRDDPARGWVWTATVEKRRDPDGSEGWIVTSAPAGLKLVDRRADTPFFEHLVETLRTLEATDRAPDDSLPQHGLVPPRMILRIPGQTGAGEARLGSAAPQGGSYAVFPPDSRIWQARGAALAMLERIEGFETIRARTLLTVELGDIDRFEHGLGARKRSHVLAQKHWSEPVRQWLEALTHLRAMSFVDDPAEVRTFQSRLEAHPGWLFRFHGAKGQWVELRAGRVDDSLFGAVSSRPGVIFRLFPRSLVHLEGPANVVR